MWAKEVKLKCTKNVNNDHWLKQGGGGLKIVH